MIWFVDDYMKKTLENLDLCPGVDVDFTVHTELRGDVSVSVFWHEPSRNLDWYPVCQIDAEHTTIFHGEGAENPEAWPTLLKDASDRFDRWLQTGK